MNLSHLAPDTQSEIIKAVEQFNNASRPKAQDVQWFGGGGNYRLVYAAWSGCASGPHNMDRLEQADAIPGVAVEYINVNPVHVRVSGPVVGQQISRDAGEAFRLANRYGLRFGSPQVLLLNGDRVIDRLYTSDRDFIERIEEATGQSPQRGRQGARGRY